MVDQRQTPVDQRQNNGPQANGGPTSKPQVVSFGAVPNVGLRPAAGAIRGPGQLLFSDEEGKLSRELSEFGHTPHSALPRGRRRRRRGGAAVDLTDP